MDSQFMGFIKKWPKPKINCDECNGKMVLRWGDSYVAHFAHILNKNHNCNGTEESMKHMIAKNIIATLLNL